jgi:hypothetical protein
MAKHHPFFSPLSCGLALLFLLAVIVLIIVIGGQIFNPGPLTAAHPQNKPLQDFASHADFEPACWRCHSPLLGPTAGRCLACHTGVAAQISAETALHGFLARADNCLACHPDHRGREARLLPANIPDFPHQALTRFSLVQHRADYDGSPLECAACHPNGSYKFEPTICTACHIRAEPAFVKHQLDFGLACLDCHDGGPTAPFDHALFFPLAGAHAGVACQSCHANRQFKGLPHTCEGCHAGDDIHRGQFGRECRLCHSPAGWPQLTVSLADHLFPLDHKNEGQAIACQVCHPSALTRYTCYGCHEHNPAKIERKHLEEGIGDFQNCAGCHPTGREDEAKEEEDDD